MKLHVEVSGHGPDLALLHGWGMHGGIWDGVRGDLTQCFRVHVVDLPGYGASPACQPYDLEHLVRTVAQALPSGIGVVGWSMGGLVAQRWAQILPQQVKKLMLVGTSPRFAQGPDWPCGIEPDVLRTFARDLEQDYAATLLRFLSLQARNGEHVRTVMKYLRLALFARGVPSAPVLQAGLNLLLETDLRAAANGLAMPVSIVHGERDMLAPADAARWLAGRVPDAKLTLIPGCAHAPFLSHPNDFLQAVTEFFQ
jgi:pimeloyl-[acyl-carrier protein] methyl ester esterase